MTEEIKQTKTDIVYDLTNHVYVNVISGEVYNIQYLGEPYKGEEWQII